MHQELAVGMPGYARFAPGSERHDRDALARRQARSPICKGSSINPTPCSFPAPPAVAQRVCHVLSLMKSLNFFQIQMWDSPRMWLLLVLPWEHALIGN
ncbi:hypothetical protein DV515_00008133 [Chloebia gouldiae]|uniref:Uncharacterized protein n=1 Tax=Chloebia gouldiae TaxID=44316 RepID=A0A3L8SG00_CHLGU|nr:hypothetical protein DV515_00008133 [Chloebia gouldiae]